MGLCFSKSSCWTRIPHCYCTFQISKLTRVLTSMMLWNWNVIFILGKRICKLRIWRLLYSIFGELSHLPMFHLFSWGLVFVEFNIQIFKLSCSLSVLWGMLFFGQLVFWHNLKLDVLIKMYKKAKSNLEALEKLGASLLFGVDATKMKLHTDLKMRKFDRIIYNFPHAGFHGKEDNRLMIK